MPSDPPPPWVLYERRLVGDRIRQLRLSRRLTQEALAERVGMDAKTITRIERATYTTSLDRLIRIAAGLGVPLRRLFEPPVE